ncbi:MAG: hypothetical protein MPJ78_19855 [Hyphomicrobiaceae bacterium]|nr:hypothetical protein [Hyphomicrobiaceae bacterium]
MSARAAPHGLPEYDEKLRRMGEQGARAYEKALKTAHKAFGGPAGTALSGTQRQQLAHALEALKDARAYAIREGDRHAREAMRLATLADNCGTLLNPAVTLHDIARAVCRKYGIALKALKSPSRSRNVAAARHEFFYLARTLTARSYGEIGRWCGDRDHTTVMYGEGRHKARMSSHSEAVGQQETSSSSEAVGQQETSSSSKAVGPTGNTGGRTLFRGSCSGASRTEEGGENGDSP